MVGAADVAFNTKAASGANFAPACEITHTPGFPSVEIFFILST